MSKFYLSLHQFESGNAKFPGQKISKTEAKEVLTEDTEFKGENCVCVCMC